MKKKIEAKLMEYRVHLDVAVKQKNQYGIGFYSGAIDALETLLNG